MRHLIPALIAAALMAVLIALDIARPLGAHPWWSQKTLLIGTPIGVILATLASPLSTATKRLIVFALLTVAALFTAEYGQTQFAASYAEDAFAGKLWYFGWIATGVAMVATITAAVQWVRGMRGVTP